MLDETPLEEYWKVIRRSFQDTPSNAASAIEAIFRVLETLDLRMAKFDSVDENNATTITISRVPLTHEWRLVLECPKPRLVDRGHKEVRGTSFARAVQGIFDAVALDFQADLEERLKDSNSLERQLAEQRHSVRAISQLRGMLGVYLPEQLSLFPSDNSMQ